MKNITMIIDRFDVSIAKIEKSNLLQLIELNQKIKITQDCLNELREEVKLNEFETHKKEIHFFKKQKPYIKGRLKFYLTLNTYLLEKPVGSKSEQRKFIDLQLSYVRIDFYRYIDFVNYYKMNETKNDSNYFLRGTNQFELFIDDTNIFEDPQFCTVRDHLAAKIVANDLLNQYFTNELELLKKDNTKSVIQEVQNTKYFKIPWTGSKTELAELVKGLNAVGAIGNGNLDAKQIEEICTQILGEDIGNIYNIFEQIKARKNNQTKFIDKMSKALLNEISLNLQKL